MTHVPPITIGAPPFLFIIGGVGMLFLLCLGCIAALLLSEKTLKACPETPKAEPLHPVKSAHLPGMGPYPPKEEDDPLNPPPRAMQEILFADGHRLTPADIYKVGLTPLINHDGRIVALLDLSKPGKGSVTVEEWCGAVHGARIT